jgi:hypothetical protein
LLITHISRTEELMQKSRRLKIALLTFSDRNV